MAEKVELVEPGARPQEEQAEYLCGKRWLCITRKPSWRGGHVRALRAVGCVLFVVSVFMLTMLVVSRVAYQTEDVGEDMTSSDRQDETELVAWEFSLVISALLGSLALIVLVPWRLSNNLTLGGGMKMLSGVGVPFFVAWCVAGALVGSLGCLVCVRGFGVLALAFVLSCSFLHLICRPRH